MDERSIQLDSFPRRTSVFAGALVCLGWLLHDALVFLRNGPPTTFLELGPRSLVIVCVGAALAALLRSRRGWVAFLVVSFAGSMAPFVVELELSRAEVWIPRVALLFGLALGGAQWLSSALCERRGVLAFAFLGGLAACAAKTAYRHGLAFVPAWLIGALFVALVLALATRARWANLAALFAAVVPLGRSAALVGERLELPRPDLPRATARAEVGAPNVLLVVLDTVRADRLGAYGYERDTTPGLDQLVDEHMTLFTDAHSSSSWTLPSHASLLTGLLPAEHGATNPRTKDDRTLRIAIRPAQPLADEHVTLAERLRADGYRTGAILANCAYLNHRFRLDQGFDHYDDRAATFVDRYIALAQLGGYRLEVGRVPYRDATRITDLALDWIAAREQEREPFFLMLNYMDAHEPYIPRVPYDRAFGGDTPPDPLTATSAWWPLLYDRALLYLDRELTRLLRAIETAGLFDDTLIVVTSDHGQELGERGFAGHAWTLFEEAVKVPLFVRPPGGRTSRVDERPIDNASTHDLILELLGGDVEFRARAFPTWAAELYAGQANPGVRAWAERVGRDLTADRVAWLADGRKWIVSSAGEVHAFDLVLDPGELHPLELDDVERDAARARARAWWAAHPPPEPIRIDLDAELEQSMEKLGYGG